MTIPSGTRRLCDRADADFVEMKAYMHVGHSRGRLDRDSMPDHSDVRESHERWASTSRPRRAKEVEDSRVTIARRG